MPGDHHSETFKPEEASYGDATPSWQCLFLEGDFGTRRVF